MTGPAPGRDAGPGGRAIWLLALGQTLGYACFFYIFAALVLDWEAALGWRPELLAAGPTLAIVLSALLAPLAGRAVDRGLGPEILTAGAAIGGLALLGLAAARAPWHYLAAWAGLGLAQALCLYEVCFAFLIRRYGLAARRAIIRVTLVAGLASTLAFPAGAALAASFGWRGAVLTAAAMAFAAIVPLNAAGARAIRRSAPPPDPDTRAAAMRGDAAAARAALSRPRFWGLGLLFALINLDHWLLISFLRPILAEKGVAEALAILAAATVGPAQVAGRLVLMRWEARIGTARATFWTLLAMVAAALALLSAGATPGLVLAFAALQGAAMGVVTILRPMLTAEALGQAGYGTIAGMLSIPALAATAAGPMLGAVILGAGGAVAVTATALVLALAALGLARLLVSRFAPGA
ncbi:MAG: MFS transporter [Rhodobacteraceae bacterium]|nr:MFS transporter [Paracoccaceae bacterium]